MAVDALTRTCCGARARPVARVPRHADRRVRGAGRGGRRGDAALRRRPGRSAGSGGPLRLLSGGRLLRPQLRRRAPTPASTTAWCRSRGRTTRWPSGCSGGGPRWRGTAGTTVSLRVAPATRTRSVVQQPGARRRVRRGAPVRHRGVRAGDQQHADGRAARARPAPGAGRAQAHPWQDEAYAAAHGGLWRQPYAPRSVARPRRPPRPGRGPDLTLARRRDRPRVPDQRLGIPLPAGVRPYRGIWVRPVSTMDRYANGGSANGRLPGFGPGHEGSSPSPPASIQCGVTQAGVGDPAAPHKGGPPGSTPGPATRPARLDDHASVCVNAKWCRQY